MSVDMPVTTKEAHLMRILDIIKVSLAIVTFLAVGGALLLIFLQGEDIKRLAEDNRRYGQVLIDCTTPNGECYKNANRNQSGAIKTINEVSILAAYCAKLPNNDTADQVRVCVEKELQKKGK